MEPINLSPYMGKQDGTSRLSGDEWNSLMSALQDKINAIVTGAMTEAERDLLLKHLEISSKGNFQVKNTSNFAWKAKDAVADFDGVIHAKGDIILYQAWHTGTEEEIAAKLAFYQNGGLYSAKANTINHAGEPMAAKATISTVGLTDAQIAFYADTNKFYINAKNGKATLLGADAENAELVAEIGTIVKGTKIAYNKLGDTRALYEADSNWDVKELFSYANNWERDYANINIETAGNVKFQGKAAEFLNVDENDEDIRMEKVSVGADEVKLNSGIISFKHNITKNGVENGNNTVLNYTRENGVIADIATNGNYTTDEQRAAALKANYIEKYGSAGDLTDADFLQMYTNFTTDPQYAAKSVQATIEQIVEAPSKVAALETALKGAVLTVDDTTHNLTITIGNNSYTITPNVGE